MVRVNAHWYRQMFDAEWLRYFAQKLPPDQTRREVDFLLRAVQPEPGARILDLACGIGRHSLELARRGYGTVGLDQSESAVETARRAASELERAAEFVLADMRELAYDGEFDLVINMFTAFGLLEDEAEDQRVLDGAARALKPGGALFMDTANALWLFRHFETHGRKTLYDGTLMLEERSYDWRRGRVETRLKLLYTDGSSKERESSLRLYTLVELEAMLRRAGLAVEATWGDFEGAAYGFDAPRMIVLARKLTAEQATA